jgi:integrase/recombinase XerD
MTDHAIVPNPDYGVIEAHEVFDELRELVNRTLQSEKSHRVYQHTYDLWADWSHNHGIHPLDMTPGNVSAFLADHDTTKATRQRQLSAMRKLAQLLAVLDPERGRQLYDGLKLIKAPTTKGSGKERSKRALNPAEVDRVLRAWNGDTYRDRRNRALLAVLFLSGVRRSEAVALKWSDVDLTEGVLKIRHGKGDKARDAALMGNSAIDALKDWRATQGDGRTYVFCPTRRWDKLGPDKPMPDTDVYRVIQDTHASTGIAFSPHDARRTLLTEFLATGGALADAQAQAGHADGSTTLAYASAGDARERRRKARLRYG